MNDQNYVDNGHGLLVPQDIRGHGRYEAQIIRAGEVIDQFEFDNLVANEGLNSLLGVYLHGDTQITAWYMGVFEGNYTPVSSDTAAVIASNSTESSAYTSSTRPSYTPASPSAQSITNSANRATFTFNATKNIYGAFIISSATIGGTAGTLFSAARFPAAKPVQNNDQLLLTYTFNAASA